MAPWTLGDTHISYRNSVPGFRQVYRYALSSIASAYHGIVVETFHPIYTGLMRFGVRNHSVLQVVREPEVVHINKLFTHSR